MEMITHNGLFHIVVEDEPQNGDLVLTDNHGLWTFVTISTAIIIGALIIKK